MVEVLCDKLRFSEALPTGFVHTVELSRDAPLSFITVWVCSPTFETCDEMKGHVEKNPELIQHDPKTFHADDEAYGWIDERYPENHQRHWRQHFHWMFETDPKAKDVAEVLADLGGSALSPSLINEIFTHLDERIAA